ncbi:MAG: hypothetical protein KDA22_15405, partial [Phycisphaerales bacterium]|nr:hypothetical protein [Phycisphaerales bacterium]
VANLVERLNRTASAFLGMEIGLVANLQRMEPLDSAGQVAFPRTDQDVGAAPTLGDVLDWIHDATLESSRRLERIDDGPSRARPRPATESAGSLEPNDHRPPVRSLASGCGRADTPPEPTPATGASPRVTSGFMSSTPPSAPGSELATAIGLRPLPLRCPEQGSVELAVDEAGRLCLVAPLAELPALLAAEGWAQRNRELLGLAFAQAGCHANETRLHAVTDTPADASSLAGTRIHLHVRAPVRGQQGIGWYVAPLNRPASAP